MKQIRILLALAAAAAIALLLIHGRKDRFVHPWMSEQNYAASASSDKRLCMVDDANHGQSFAASPDRVKHEILDFLQTHE